MTSAEHEHVIRRSTGIDRAARGIFAQRGRTVKIYLRFPPKKPKMGEAGWRSLTPMTITSTSTNANTRTNGKGACHGGNLPSELLEILVCPETHQRVTLAPAECSAAQGAPGAGALQNRAGAALTEPLAGALLREDGAIAYPILDGIPIMLIDEGIPLNQLQG